MSIDVRGVNVYLGSAGPFGPAGAAGGDPTYADLLAAMVAAGVMTASQSATVSAVLAGGVPSVSQDGQLDFSNPDQSGLIA